ncbi:hypothetical protein EKK58_03905 [Candidatus Dependentiae bacterium]|nr:MAG: hypothetical protein EKK58_03905 [Candidatus Dependentiae bacterium]
MKKQHILITIFSIVAYINSSDYQLASIETVSSDVFGHILSFVDPIGYDGLLDAEMSPALGKIDLPFVLIANSRLRCCNPSMRALAVTSTYMLKKVENIGIYYSYVYTILNNPEGHVKQAFDQFHEQGKLELFRLKTNKKFDQYPNALSVSCKIFLTYNPSDRRSKYALHYTIELPENTNIYVQHIGKLKKPLHLAGWQPFFELFLQNDNEIRNKVIEKWICLFVNKFTWQKGTNPIDSSAVGQSINSYTGSIYFNGRYYFLFSLFYKLVEMRIIE